MYILSMSILLAVAAHASASCVSDFGPGATDSVTSYWQFSAYDPATGTTTGLRLFQADTIPHTTYYVLAPGAGTIPWDGFKLEGGEPTAYPPSTGIYSNLAPVHYVGLESPPYGNAIYPTPAPFLLFSNTFTPPSGVSCSIPNPPGGDNIVSLNGRTDLFSLCRSEFTPFSGYTLLFNASTTSYLEGPGTYDESTCYPVTVLIVPV